MSFFPANQPLENSKVNAKDLIKHNYIAQYITVLHNTVILLGNSQWYCCYCAIQTHSICSMFPKYPPVKYCT